MNGIEKTLFMWEILLYAAIGLYIIASLVLMIGKFVKNRYYHEYHNDELIKTTKTANSLNKLYFTHGTTAQFIYKYVLCKTVNDKYVICNYARSFRKIGFFVVCYNARRKVTQVIKAEETFTTQASSVISIDRNVKYVNIVIGSVDDKVINKNVIQPLSLKRIRKYSFFKSVSMFCAFFILRHAIGYLITGPYIFKQFLLSEYNLISVLGMLIVCALSGLIRTRVLRKRNMKASKGGVIEYEFI